MSASSSGTFANPLSSKRCLSTSLLLTETADTCIPEPTIGSKIDTMKFSLACLVLSVASATAAFVPAGHQQAFSRSAAIVQAGSKEEDLELTRKVIFDFLGGNAPAPAPEPEAEPAAEAENGKKKKKGFKKGD